MRVSHTQSLIAVLLGLVVASTTSVARAEPTPPERVTVGTECGDIVSEVRAAIEKHPDNVLMIVEDALVIHESCAGRIVQVAVEAAKADTARINDIVQAAIAVVPQQAVVITETAKAVAPHAEITRQDWYKAVAKNQMMHTSVGMLPDGTQKKGALVKLMEDGAVPEGEISGPPAPGAESLALVSTSDLKGKAWEAIYRFNPSGVKQKSKSSGSSGKNPAGKNPVGKEAYSILPDEEEDVDGEGDMSSPTYFASSVPTSIRGMYLLQPTPVNTVPPRKGDSTPISPSTAIAKN